MIADRLRTVSLSNDSHQNGVVKPVYEIQTFSFTAKVVKIKRHIKHFWIILFIKKTQGQTGNQSIEAIEFITQTCNVIKTVYQK